jgi:acyl-CoA reductase-like NAD-dependent aldehyde dehydrogenase
MQMFLEGRWMNAARSLPVINPYDGKPFDEVPLATAADVERAMTTLIKGAAAMRALSAWA